MHTKALTVICDWNDLIKTQASKGALNEESELRGFETRVVNFIRVLKSTWYTLDLSVMCSFVIVIQVWV